MVKNVQMFYESYTISICSDFTTEGSYSLLD